MPRTLQGAPELSAAEREALGVLAEHTRDRARLDCVWLFAHPADPESDAAVELLAGACSRSSQPLAEAAARAALVRHVRGDRRRFDRGRGAETAGTRVATATRAHSAVSVAAQPADAAATPQVEQALNDLAGVALRLAEPPPADDRDDLPAIPESEHAPDAARASGGGRAALSGGLAEAMSRLQRPPILPQSRARLAAATDGPHPAASDVVAVVETDVGLALAVLTRANRTPNRPRGGIVSVRDAVKALGPEAIAAVAKDLPLLRPGQTADPVCTAFARMGPHGIAVRAAADGLAVHTGTSGRDTLRLIALIHDIGKVALAASSPSYLDHALDPRLRPEERVAAERGALGIDHAGLGGIALGRLGLPKSMVAAVERHHAADADGPAALIRLADLLAHDAAGDVVDPRVLAAAGAALSLDVRALRELSYELARAGGPSSGGLEPSPLTPMQHKALLGLRRGLTYKQIAADLQVSESTVRSHLHKAYERLGVVDRAQAVLLAQDRGWI